jgi:glucoamylase
MMPNDGQAPGRPGVPPRWTSSAKSGVGTALSAASRVWFTLSHGILNEIYYPRVDQSCTRDMGFVVTDGHSFFSEEKRAAQSEITTVAPGVPAYRLVNTCRQGRYRVEKEIVADPRRDVLLQRIRFAALIGTAADYHLYVLLAPHLANRGSGNTAFVGEHKGVPMLFAERDGVALALACSAPWLRRSVGFVGTSDGWQDLSRNKIMTSSYDRADDGNVALTGEIDLARAGESFVLALGFGTTASEAGHRALASLQDGFDATNARYVDAWRTWQATLIDLDTHEPREHSYRISASTLLTHAAKPFPGGIIASLSVPWGFTKGDDDLGGYHLIWPRDLVETAGALVAAGAFDEVRRVLSYLQATQESDGHWPQNMWHDGSPFWHGIQLDETAFPILLVDLARRQVELEADEIKRFWPMVLRAASFIVRDGPVTQQDRWEEDPGYSPFTLAVAIAALLAAADLAELSDDRTAAAYLRDTADTWNGSIERWTYVTGTELAREVGVEGYYIRVAPPEVADASSPLEGFVPIKNRPPADSSAPASGVISPDALALVRFGLRAADDPRIVDTVKVIDALLEVDTPAGRAWRRYNGDGYGEHDDGSPFDGTGRGRAWPLLTGERAHYELACGRRAAAERLAVTMAAFANEGGMLPEQVWDGPDLPEHGLRFGGPSGSAMPLVWAHAEYVKLLRSLRDGRVFDMPPQPFERYVVGKTEARLSTWRFNQKCRSIPLGRTLRVEVLAAASVHWSTDGWRTARDTATRTTSLGVHFVDLPTASLAPAGIIDFTFYWREAARWEGTDMHVAIEATTRHVPV